MSSRADQKAKAREARQAAERAETERAARRRRLLTFGGILAAAAIIVVAAVVISQTGSDDVAPPEERAATFQGIPQEGPWLGSADAPVVVEEFADLQCPFCARFATGELPGIVEDYVRPGQVRLRSRILTFLGPDSMQAGRLAAAAGLQNRQWQFLDAFYADQGPENTGYVNEEFLRGVAGQIPGLDVDRAFADRTDRQAERQLREDQAAASRNGIASTPTFLVRRGDGEPQETDAAGLRAALDAAVQESGDGT
jgi:protein-disulfide isomerase